MKLKRFAMRVCLVTALLLSLAAGCVEKDVKKEVEKDLPPVNISNVQSGITDFSAYYSIEPLSFSPSLPAYGLPLSPTGIYNFEDLTSKVLLSAEAEDMLMTNGFVVIRNPLYGKEEDMQSVYDDLKEKDIPIFITTDSLLHLYHIQFDETLRRIEEDEFFGDIWDMSVALLEDAVEKYENSSGDVREASKRSAAYFAVALSLLEAKEEQVCTGGQYECNGWETFFTQEEGDYFTADVPSVVLDEVDSELALIQNHAGFNVSPVFHYMEDYSQYVPRGHYVRSEKLKNYFMALMWYGRMTFLLKKDLIEPGNPAYDADIQTMQAALISSAFAQDGNLKDKWDRIYSVTSFYVGISDDLSFYEYLEAMNSVFGSSFDPNDLSSESTGRLKAKLAEFRAPKIYGGTGNCEISPPYSPEQADECLEKTKGLRLMGQRFVPDSYVFSNLVGSYTGFFTGEGDEPFTLVESAGPIRGFPRGLDIMAILGSQRAMAILEASGDTDYELYNQAFSKLMDEFNAFDEAEWNKNLYFSWLNALRSLLDVFGEGYPTFMHSEAWLDKELVSALASWAELRHDTILYAKQSYTMDAVGEGDYIVPERVVGYVEPVPRFYNRLLALTSMTRQGLDAMNVLDDTSRSRLSNLELLLAQVRDVALKELEGNELSEEDVNFINDFPERLEGVLSEVRKDALKTTVVADVHTDGNTGKVLEEGVGYIKLIVVAYNLPDGTITLGAGPVFSYYEFKHPSRLTDEAWRTMLESNPPPSQPEWIGSFAVR